MISIDENIFSEIVSVMSELACYFEYSTDKSIINKMEKVNRLLNRVGYYRCDVPACNCRGYHYSGNIEYTKR